MNTTANTTKTLTVGDGVTVGAGSDRYPCTVIEVSASGKQVTVQHDEVMVVSNSDGMGNGDYVTLPDPDGRTEVYTFRKNGYWMMKGVPVSARYGFLGTSGRRYYRDPSF